MNLCGRKVGNIHILDHSDKIARCLEHTCNLFICNTDKLESAQEFNTQKVVAMNLRSSKFVPSRDRTTGDGYFPVNPSALVKTVVARLDIEETDEWSANPEEMRYSPLGLQSRPLTAPRCPLTPGTSVQSSSTPSDRDVQRQCLHPPPHPDAKASMPSLAHRPHTKPPSL
jgi:hypothetical protein